MILKSESFPPWSPWPYFNLDCHEDDKERIPSLPAPVEGMRAGTAERAARLHHPHPEGGGGGASRVRGECIGVGAQVLSRTDGERGSSRVSASEDGHVQVGRAGAVAAGVGCKWEGQETKLRGGV